jgi:hypothetical protein
VCVYYLSGLRAGAALEVGEPRPHQEDIYVFKAGGA